MATTVTLKPNAIDISGSTSGTTTLQATAVAGTTTLTLPAATDTLVGKATTDTLTNKTLTGAVMNGTLGATTPSTVAATSITASTTLGVTGVATFSAGTAALPAITTTGDTNTGIFFPAADTIAFTEGGAEAMRIDSDGDVGIGTTSPSFRLHAVSSAAVVSRLGSSGGSGAFVNFIDSGASPSVAPSVGAIGDNLVFMGDGSSTERARIDSSGNLLVGTTSGAAKLRVLSTASQSNGFYITHPTTAQDVISCENSATSGDNVLIAFYTDATVARGSINYNRGAGLVAYNVTSDYRAKDISGPVVDSGALIDSVPVYMGKMKGATQERPMFIAHEVPAYAHTGEKDAVDANGKPIYQQMDTSALVPVMWAEIQSLRKRLADAGI
jgi:hypothetical protein